MIPVRIIGMGMGVNDLPARNLQLIEQSDVLVGGKRHLDDFMGLACQKLEIRSPIANVVQAIRQSMESRRVVILASGDPLFFGIGRILMRELGEENVEILPNYSCLTAAFARIKKPWANLPVVSLHGRAGEHALAGALVESPLVFVLTGPGQGPAQIGAWLIDNRILHVTLHVMENMGSPKERTLVLSPAQAAETDFYDPNVVVLEQKEPDSIRQRPVLGAPEDWYEHENDLITKSEVRAVTLSKLRLHDGMVLWDLGAGSGSLSCEAGLLIRNSPIVAVEKNPNRVAHIHANRKKFRVWNMQIVHAELPRGLGGLPAPDRIFIGGGGRNLKAIIQTSADRLSMGGVMVANTILLENFHECRIAMEDAGLSVGIVQVQISRSSAMPYGQRLVAQNPVWILSGIKKESIK